MNKLSHVAFIMDGNGRWGIKKKKTRNFGHLNGVETVKKIVEASIKLEIPVVTFYVFSTENWKRPKTEITFLFNLISSYFKKEIDQIMKNQIKINIIGETKKLPKRLIKILKTSVRKTKSNKKILVNLAVNYGSKKEIINSVNRIRANKSINENSLTKNLYTYGIPNPDILIRTGGQKRLSNFMLWQLAYAEIYFIDKLWPDFSIKDLKKIIHNYKNIQRNFGGL
jgi:undecaprenyl diphosphate synthase